jgi:hypothetical protein
MDRPHVDMISALLCDVIPRMGRCNLNLHWAECPPEQIQAQVLQTTLSRDKPLAPTRLNDMAAQAQVLLQSPGIFRKSTTTPVLAMRLANQWRLLVGERAGTAPTVCMDLPDPPWPTN